MFSPWIPLNEENLVDLPGGPAAVQLRRAEGLWRYPNGQSTLVCFFFVDVAMADALRRHFGAELSEPGHFGVGPLWFRHYAHEGAEATIGRRYTRFVARFGAPPVLQHVLSA